MITLGFGAWKLLISQDQNALSMKPRRILAIFHWKISHRFFKNSSSLKNVLNKMHFATGWFQNSWRMHPEKSVEPSLKIADSFILHREKMILIICLFPPMLRANQQPSTVLTQLQPKRPCKDFWKSSKLGWWAKPSLQWKPFARSPFAVQIEQLKYWS